MKTTIFYLLLVTLLFDLRTAWGENTVEIGPPNSRTLIHRLYLDGNDYFYGTAILYKILGNHAFFVTNAHLLPQGNDISKLKLRGYVFRDDLNSSLTVVGSAPGYDIAVLELETHGNFQDGIYKNKIEKIFTSIFKKAPLDIRKYHTGIWGYSNPFLKQGEDATFRYDEWGLELKGMTSKMLDRAHPSGVRLERTTICPPLFLRNCYKIDISSRGYSGGALVISKNGGKYAPSYTNESIIGMVSHYSPLSSSTYVIPIDMVLAVAERIRLQAIDVSTPVHELDDDFGTFRYLGPNKLLVLKGSLAGEILQSSGAEFSGGGGDLSGGGGDLSGGGGDLSSGVGEVSVEDRNLFPQPSKIFSYEQRFSGLDVPVFLGHIDDNLILSSISDAHGWFSDSKNWVHQVLAFSQAWSGIQSLFHFTPGVQFSGRPEPRKADFLQEFISLYYKNYEVADQLSETLPNHMTSLDAGEKIEVPLLSFNPNGSWFAYPTARLNRLKTLCLSHDYVEASMEVSASDHSASLVIFPAAGSPFTQGVKLKLLREFDQTGLRTFEYFGPVTIGDLAFDRSAENQSAKVENTRSEFAAIIIQGEPESKTFEAKIFIVGAPLKGAPDLSGLPVRIDQSVKSWMQVSSYFLRLRQEPTQVDSQY